MLPDTATLCPQCGSRLKESPPAAVPQPVAASGAVAPVQLAAPPQANAAWTNGCPRCGAFVPSEGTFCPQCGARVKSASGALQPGRMAWNIGKAILAVVITVAFLVIAALGAILAACAGMNINSPPTAEAQQFQAYIVGGLCVLFLIWVVCMVFLLM
ncbi:MAG: zinc ribbon domain-containing protein [Abitibacteriaceae bacterium]|nr:zinc ribbon domain-containing protein [Abditibacteriaceae bacterium]